MKIVTYILIYILLGCVHPLPSKEQIEVFPDGNFLFSPGWSNDSFFDHFAKEVDLFLSNHTLQMPGKPKKVVVFNTATPAALKKMLSMPIEDRILVIMEPPSVCKGLHDQTFHNLFGKILTWDDATVDGSRYIKFQYPVWKNMVEDLPSFKEKKLCCSISANKHSSWPAELYSERKRAIEFFSTKEGEFDMYGVGWEGAGISSYKGQVDDKLLCMKKYRFSICYENTSDMNGYITEKIFDSFAAGCVPVYLGAPNVESYIPKGCYIDKRDFPTYEKLYSYLKNMREEEYMGYIENIRKFLNTKEAKAFSFEQFSKILTKACLDE